MKSHARLLERHLTGHHLSVELLESGGMLGVPDNVKTVLVVVFDVGQKTSLAKIGEDESEIARISVDQARRRNVERPAERVHRIRSVIMAAGWRARRAEAGARACLAEARAAGGDGGEHARDIEPRHNARPAAV